MADNQRTSSHLFADADLKRMWQQHPVVFVDIGAKGGLPPHWRPLESQLEVIGFEPDARSFEELSSGGPSRKRYLRTALYREKATLPLYLTRDSGDSSVLSPNKEWLSQFLRAERFDVVGTSQMEADTLDNVLQENQIADVDFIKIDTQGSELAILEGARQTLSRAVCGIEIEVEFTPIYKDQPLFSDIDKFLAGFGLQLFDLSPIYWKRRAGHMVGGPKGQIVFANALYLRDLSVLRGTMAEFTPEQRASKLVRYLTAAIVYGYFDYALQVLETNGDLLDRDTAQLVRQKLTARVPLAARLPNFPGRRRLTHLLRKVVDVLELPHGAGIKIGGTRSLGNMD